MTTPKQKQLEEVKIKYENGLSQYFEFDKCIQLLRDQIETMQDRKKHRAFKNKVLENEISYLLEETIRDDS